MPIYVFLCTNKECEHNKEEFEVIFHSWNENTSKQTCPKCSQQARKIPAAHGKHGSWSNWNTV